ncbi:MULTISPECIES: SDR family oxidoreductase [unclassified Bacillus (in: firmicutes)]|uniref:SDR family oxidoreductase n=1 Tax=unclassified Bacillus (in: firmicutes) TaxID=185979 RepID=UPI0008E7488C|nr:MULTISPECIES: SDR family oxidoreductase [unclassified Bacillus (in: firmicutes)]SFA77547.1 Thioester reductase domain-containing protein [Bacillus sp. UNCCL13]SFQ67467.1 Thioester reductase domain-containing protein [Bacillus sp. cl95]
MEKGYFFTGFPGFICNQLIRQVIKKTDMRGVIYTLVLPKMMSRAIEERNQLVKECGILDEQFVIIEGDITALSLGLSPAMQMEIKEKINYVFHLAAIYDLAVNKDVAVHVNVNGTKNVNKFVRGLPNIKRYTYFSTGFIAGRREGKLYEHELIRPSQFKNYYEETKFEAEVMVEMLKKDVPVTIIRPGIVKGNTKTGETIKFDGPYFIMNFIDRLRFLPFLPRLGESEAVVNLVPIEYIVAATTYLSFHEGGEGKTYHLTDPSPYKVSELYEMLMEELINKRPRGSIPLSAAQWGLSIKPLRRYLGVEKEALDYFSWLGQFDCTQAQMDLLGSGISCPDFKDGVPAMVSFYMKNKDNPRYQVKII